MQQPPPLSRSRKKAQVEEVVPSSNRFRETIFSVATISVIAFGTRALFEFLWHWIAPASPRRPFDSVPIAFGALLAIALTLFGRREIFKSAKPIEQQRDLLRLVTDG